MSDIEIPSGWRDRLEEIAGRRGEIAAVAGLVAVAALVALVFHSRTAPVVAPPAVAVGPAPSPSAGVVLVHVAGAVRDPGLYEVAADGRVADAISAAGGPRPAADLDGLNLAEVLRDGQKIDVPRRGESPDPAASPVSTLGPVSLNAADHAGLETLPGIGPAKAAAIIAYRDSIGSFESIEQLLEVDGIGPATLENIRPYVNL